MNLEPTSIPDVVKITPLKHMDERGYFCETWNQRTLKENGLNPNFVQDNQSLSTKKGTLRGLHYQLPPSGQAKLVRCLAGEILDVAVDLRKTSDTFGKHVTVVLGENNFTQLFIPEGFAHGFITLTENTIVSYKVTSFYDKSAERTILWNDPVLKIDWPTRDVSLSDKDLQGSYFKDSEFF